MLKKIKLTLTSSMYRKELIAKGKLISAMQVERKAIKDIEAKHAKKVRLYRRLQEQLDAVNERLALYK